MKETIENPDKIKESTTVENSLIYISETENRCDFNVFTKFSETFDDAIVTTAYKTRKPISGKIIWPK